MRTLPAGLTPFNIETFQGLALHEDPPESGGALDMLNVDLDQRGRMRSRDGYALFTAAPAASRYVNLGAYYQRTGPKQLIATRADGLIVALNTSGAQVASASVQTGFEAAPRNFARFGTPSAEYLFGGYRRVGSPQIMMQWDGTSMTFQNVTAGGKFVAVSQADNRLVTANISDQGLGSGVRFSDAGAPTTFSANNYVTLSPGDGEEITGLVSWGPYVFAFKPSRYYAFTNTNTDAQGNPIFDYRRYDLGVGASGDYCAVAGRDGVYFLHRTGIYRTRGGEPELISQAIEPIFRGAPSPIYQGGVLNHAQIGLCALAWHQDRLYVAYPSGSSTANDRVLVFDSKTQGWVLWAAPVAGMAAFRVANTDELMFSLSSGTNDVARLAPAYTTDNGVAITARYQSSFMDLGSPAREKTIRETELVGSGSVRFAWARDFNSPGSPQSVSMSSAPQIGRGLHRYATPGELLSFQVSDVSGAPFAVSRVTPMLREVRGVGEKTS